MCGLVGMASCFSLSNDHKKIFNDMLFIDMLRGMHSTGLLTVTMQNSVDTYKRAVEAMTFMDTKKYGELLGKNNLAVLAGHNRHATKGGINHANAHPFVHDQIVLMHNGTLNSVANLTKHTDFSTDSEAIAYNMAQAEPDNARSVIEKLNGAYALVWWDGRDNTLNFIRNKERPLFYATDKELFAESKYFSWASELDMISMCHERHLDWLERYKRVPEMKHHKVSLKGRTLELVSVQEYEEYTPVVSVYVANRGNYGGAKQAKKQQEKNESDNKKQNGNVIAMPNVASGIQPPVPDYFPARGTRLKLLPLEWVAYGSEEGKGKGVFVAESPYNPKEVVNCSIHVLSKKEYEDYIDKEGYDLVAKVLNIGWVEADQEYCCVMNEKMHIKREEAKEEPEKKKSESESEESGVRPLSGVLGGSPIGMEVPFIEGYGQRMLTHKEWNHLTRDGCARCCRDLLVTDSPDVYWLDSQTPLCLQCSAEYSYEEGLSNEEELDAGKQS